MHRATIKGEGKKNRKGRLIGGETARVGAAVGRYFLCSVFPGPSAENGSLSAASVGLPRQGGRGRDRRSDKLSPE